jgi:hypothetical protein
MEGIETSPDNWRFLHHLSPNRSLGPVAIVSTDALREVRRPVTRPGEYPGTVYPMLGALLETLGNKSETLDVPLNSDEKLITTSPPLEAN